MCAMRVLMLSSSSSSPSGGLGAAQFLDKISLERSAYWSDRNQALPLTAQRIDHSVLLAFVNDGADPVSGDMAFRAQSLDRGWYLRSVPDHLHLALNA